MNSRHPVFFFVVVFVAFVGGLWYFSDGVRSVDVVGLFASGVACGAAFVGLIMSVRRMKKPA